MATLLSRVPCICCKHSIVKLHHDSDTCTDTFGMHVVISVASKVPVWSMWPVGVNDKTAAHCIVTIATHDRLPYK